MGMTAIRRNERDRQIAALAPPPPPRYTYSPAEVDSVVEGIRKEYEQKIFELETQLEEARSANASPAEVDSVVEGTSVSEDLDPIDGDTDSAAGVAPDSQDSTSTDVNGVPPSQTSGKTDGSSKKELKKTGK